MLPRQYLAPRPVQRELLSCRRPSVSESRRERVDVELAQVHLMLDLGAATISPLDRQVVFTAQLALPRHYLDSSGNSLGG